LLSLQNRAIEVFGGPERGFDPMTTTLRRFSASAAVSFSLVLSGCLGGGPSNPPVRSPTGVEGAWIDAQGTGLSTLSGGAFRTVATDTGQKLAEGSYVMSGQNGVQITGTSLIRQSPISFNCILISTSQLNCTSSAGQQFILTRRA
jgi:hypothetical protein